MDMNGGTAGVRRLLGLVWLLSGATVHAWSPLRTVARRSPTTLLASSTTPSTTTTATAATTGTAAAAAGDAGANDGVAESPVFCNRELKLSNVEAVGFDMDYTLAQYFTDFDLLAFDGAVDKLVAMGYPEQVREFKYNPTDFSRGLVIDKVHGNILKMDRYKYVQVAHHGSRLLSVAARKALYQERHDVMPTFTGNDFVNVDTLFQLVDAALYAQLVDLKDKLAEDPDGPQIEQSFFQLYTDVRKCVDLCHRDGVIKDRVAEDPGKYVKPDPRLFPMLQRFRRSGKKVFLLTNSLWDYTTVVMNFLYGNDIDNRNEDWLDYFDLVICGSCKPAFLQDPYLSLFRVNTADHTLVNTDGPAPGAPQAKAFLAEGKVFQGGNWNHLHSMLNLPSGDSLLYVGDHMYSDILRSKRSLGWRTCLVIPELESQLAAYRRAAAHGLEMNRIRRLRDMEDDAADALRLRLCDDFLDSQAATAEELAEELADATERRNLLHEELKQLLGEYNQYFHPRWGQLFKTGFMDSRFAKQVADYACLYTTQVSDLGEVSPQREFRAVSDRMPHDQANRAQQADAA